MEALATGIGSLPHKDPDEAVDLVVRYFEETPFWPQLPKRSRLEGMYLQYSEGFPCLVREEERIWFDSSKKEDLEALYDHYLKGDLEYFRITRPYAEALYTLVEKVKGAPFIKAQITGPITLGLTLKDESGKAIFYDREIYGAVLMALEKKALWLVNFLKEVGERAMIFIDEPYLASIGSAFVGIGKGDVVDGLKAILTPLKERGVITGVHCCGNTDWGLLLGVGADILSFDAYSFIETVSLYPDELNRFLGDGGRLAWGIVPSSNKVMEESVDSLMLRFGEGRRLLTKAGVDEAGLQRLLITPSCGLGSLGVKEAVRALELTHGLLNRLRMEG